MSDEQMFKMDKLLAAVLRTQKDAKDKSKNTKQVRPLLRLPYMTAPLGHNVGKAKISLRIGCMARKRPALVLCMLYL